MLPKKRALAAIEYHGRAELTRSCVRAVERLLHDAAITRALVLTCRDGQGGHHALLLHDADDGRIAIKSGFRSGYPGEGPKGLSRVLTLLDWHAVELDEVLVRADLLERLDDSALTLDDLEWLEAAARVRPARFWDYIDIARFGARAAGNPWRSTEESKMPFALIADPLADLARTFEASPDATLAQAHRRLETCVRARLGEPQNSDLGGVRLFKKAFVGPDRRLHWPDASASEHDGRANLFIGCVLAYRNRRAHVESLEDSSGQLMEFLLLNHLFHLESRAVEAPGTPTSPSGGSSE